MNKTSNFRATAGFTLVELSVVIVIISLLVGGLAGLRSYTRNAALTTMMNESKFYIDAFSQFQTRYNNPPGDYCSTATVCSTNASATANLVWPSANNGDGNGIIRAASTAIPVERYLVFQHLALAGFIQGKFSGAGDTSGTGATIGKGDSGSLGNVPGSNMTGVAFMFDHPDAQDGNVSGETDYFNSSDAGLYGNVLRVAGLNDDYAGIPDAAFLTPKQTLQLDEKYDDGAPGKGNLLVTKSNTNCYTDASTYNVASDPDGKRCSLILKFQ